MTGRIVPLFGDRENNPNEENYNDVMKILEEEKVLLEQAKQKREEAQKKCLHDWGMDVALCGNMTCRICGKYFVEGKDFTRNYEGGGGFILKE